VTSGATPPMAAIAKMRWVHAAALTKATTVQPDAVRKRGVYGRCGDRVADRVL
jgi:hypothetical protein